MAHRCGNRPGPDNNHGPSLRSAGPKCPVRRRIDVPAARLLGVEDHDCGILRWPASGGFHNDGPPGKARITPAAPATRETPATPPRRSQRTRPRRPTTPGAGLAATRLADRETREARTGR